MSCGQRYMQGKGKGGPCSGARDKMRQNSKETAHPLRRAGKPTEQLTLRGLFYELQNPFFSRHLPEHGKAQNRGG